MDTLHDNILARVSNISVVQSGEFLLRDVSLDITSGEFITVVGPNGAGKSLLVSCILGLRTPDFGVVQRSSGSIVACLPQNFTISHLIPINVQDFLNLYESPMSKKDKSEIIEHIGVDKLFTKKMHSLSNGELQRVLYSKALLSNPDLLVLDEPTQNLDIRGQMEFYKILKEFYEKRKFAVLMVSHELHFVVSCTTKVVCVFRGVCCSGTPDDMTKHPEFIDTFGAAMAEAVKLYHHFH